MTWDEIDKKYPLSRDDMTTEQEQEFVNDCFTAYEEEGFSKIFVSPYDLFEEGNKYKGKPFKVIERVKLLTEQDRGDNTADLECLPMWVIQFEDGYVMGAYPEEIIPSAIKNSLWRDSDKCYLGLL